MTRTVIFYFFLFIILVVSQVVIFNRIWLFNVALPLVFIYFILSLPTDTDVKLVLTLSFILGFSVDIFSDTLGLNALCCTIAGGLRLPVIHLYVPRDDEMANATPSPRSMGRATFMKYLITMTTIYCLLFFVVLSFDFFNLGRLILRTISSSVLTFIILLAFSNFLTPSVEKRK